MGKVVTTAEYARAIPMMTQEQVESLKVELVQLTQKRKDMKRFLDIDKEKAELERLQAECKAMREKATVDSLDIVNQARKQTDQITLKAIMDKDSEKVYSDQLLKKAEIKMEEATRNLEFYNKRIETVVKIENMLKAKQDIFKEDVLEFKRKISAVARVIEEINL